MPKSPVNHQGFSSVLVHFGRALRAEGLTIGSGDLLTYCEAMASLDPTDLVDLYWGGRTALLTRHEDIEAYNEVFRTFFLGEDSPIQELLKLKTAAEASETAFQIPATDPPAKDSEEEEEEAILGLVASNVETLRQKSFAECTEEELAALRRLMKRIRLSPPKRRTRRLCPARTGGATDLRRTIRESLRTQGEMVRLCWRDRRVRLRPLILILDISGSMADYSRSLLQFAYSTKQATQKVEVFCFGTRLTRLTRALQTKTPDTALAQAAKLAFDWEGGTRIGQSLDDFVRRWGRSGMGRSGIVVICSDGLDRGDPDTLATAMERLARLCHRIVWMNPHKGDEAEYQPQSMGMSVAYPYIDELLSGHDLRSLEKFADLFAKLG